MVKSGAWSAPAVPHSVPKLRQALSRFAETAGVPNPPLADMRLAVTEAVANAIVHGYRDADEEGRVEIAAELRHDELRVVITDSGAGFSPRGDSPGLGLGLPLMRELADTVEIRSAQPGTALHLCFKITA